MHCLQKIFAGLMLFAPAAYALATPDQAQAGIIRGFTGSQNGDVTGDYLTATFCYCKYPPKIEDDMGLAHYYQFEYYNFHLNTTFVLTSACPRDDLKFQGHCVPKTSGEHGLGGYTMPEKCRTWKADQYVHDRSRRHKNQFCYEPFPGTYHTNDYIHFNGQERNLGRFGEQGPVVRKKMEPENACEDMCREILDASVFRDEQYFPSHQIVWPDIDDMCDGCE